ncbi:MAG: hypothetical protein PHR76_06985 [Flavobacterium sp.]|nr:hypothetical protein [Flavobacterium sp.]
MWYFLSGRERTDSLRFTQKDNRAVITTGAISLLASITNAILLGLATDKYIEYQSVSILLGCIIFFFLIFFNRTSFIYSEAKSKSKAIAIGFYVLVYLLLTYQETRLFLYYYLDKEIHALGSSSTSLELSESLVRVLQSLNTNQSRTVQSLRFLIGSIFFLWAILPMLNHLFYNRNQDAKLDAQTQQLLQHLQMRLLEKKMEFSNLNSLTLDPNNPFVEESSQEDLEHKREQVLSEIAHLQRSIDLL